LQSVENRRRNGPIGGYLGQIGGLYGAAQRIKEKICFRNYLSYNFIDFDIGYYAIFVYLYRSEIFRIVLAIGIRYFKAGKFAADNRNHDKDKHLYKGKSYA